MARSTRYDSAADLQRAILSSVYTYVPWRATEPVEAQIDGWSDFHHEEVTELDVEGFGHLQVIDTTGGEGQGDHAHIVFKLTEDDFTVRYYKVDGYYSSYDGVDWDGSDLYEVTPRERTITVYE